MISEMPYVQTGKKNPCLTSSPKANCDRLSEVDSLIPNIADHGSTIGKPVGEQ